MQYKYYRLVAPCKTLFIVSWYIWWLLWHWGERCFLEVTKKCNFPLRPVYWPLVDMIKRGFGNVCDYCFTTFFVILLSLWTWNSLRLVLDLAVARSFSITLGPHCISLCSKAVSSCWRGMWLQIKVICCNFLLSFLLCDDQEELKFFVSPTPHF